MANNFKLYEHSDNLIIYASGVSNINNYSRFGADREKQLLEKTILNNNLSKIVYFSSCGIYDIKNMNCYSIHKLDMEEFIKNISDNYLIFRLPIIIGKDNNKYGLCQYFFNSIKNDEYFKVWKNTYRYLIDIDDVVEIIHFILDNKYYNNEVINISSLIKINIMDIIDFFESILNKKARYDFNEIISN